MDLREWIYYLIIKFKLTVWIVQTVAMLITAAILPSLKITEVKGAFLIIFALALVNTHLWDVALFFQVPNEFSLEVLALFFCNGLIFWILVKILPGIEIKGFLPAIVAVFIFTFLTLALNISSDYIDWMGFFDYLVSFIRSVRAMFLGGGADV